MRWFIPLLLLCFSGSLSAVEERDPYTYFFNTTFGDFSEELQLARDEGKQGIMLFFEMDECPFCHWMKRNVLSRPEVQAYYREHFLLFPVDIEGDVEIVDFHGKATTQKDFAVRDYRVHATPVIAFIDLNGNVVMRYTGKTRNLEEFLWMGEFVADGHYQESNFSRYKREKRRESRQ